MNRKTIKTIMVMGSGGHTTEMLQISQKLDPATYTPRYYVVENTDTITKDKIITLEDEKRGGAIEIVGIVRSRKVNQSYFTSVFTTLLAIYSCVPLLWRIRPELVLCNGPGTCVPICIVAYLLRLSGRLSNCRIVYVESFCRVQSLSLSGKIVKRIADLFVVQWKDLMRYSKTEYFGRLL